MIARDRQPRHLGSHPFAATAFFARVVVAGPRPDTAGGPTTDRVWH
jgi:hypothetical protein